MASYAEIVKIKQELFIEGTTSDDRLKDVFIPKAERFINEQIGGFEVSTPLKDVPAYLRELANNLVVAYWHNRNNPDHPATEMKEAEKKVKEYIATHYGRTVEDFTDDAIQKTDSAVTGLE